MVAYCSNTPEVIAAFLATNALGAIWSSCSIDFGIESVTERFTQIDPKVLFVTKKYIFKGKSYGIKSKLESLKTNLKSLKAFACLDDFDKIEESDSSCEVIFETVDYSDPICRDGWMHSMEFLAIEVIPRVNKVLKHND